MFKVQGLKFREMGKQANKMYGLDCAAGYARWQGTLSGDEIAPFAITLARRRLPAAKTWLDLACGSGQLLAMVGGAGFEAFGVDQSSAQIKLAKANAPGAQVRRGDITSVRLNRKFDVVSCFGGSTNYLTTARTLRRLMTTARRHLNPQGLWLFDVNTPAGMAANAGSVTVYPGEARTMIVSMEFDAARQAGRWQVCGFIREKGGKYRRFEEAHSLRAYARAEVDAMLEAAGFAFSVYDADTLGRPSKQTLRLFYAAKSRG
jgi:SAM-dependent methyltransferase